MRWYFVVGSDGIVKDGIGLTGSGFPPVRSVRSRSSALKIVVSFCLVVNQLHGDLDGVRLVLGPPGHPGEHGVGNGLRGEKNAAPPRWKRFIQISAARAASVLPCPIGASRIKIPGVSIFAAT